MIAYAKLKALRMDANGDPMMITAALTDRVVRYGDLQPCYNAFVDSRTPGSSAKENFTIIGPGVSENPAQYVHIAEPHGFNIGGARQPPNCVNSQHSHDTAEVFVVHTGHWRFDLGEHGDDARVECGPGDVISLPTNAFRGFTNIGDDAGFLWAVLDGDDPGRVLWAPNVFDLAVDHGLLLLDSGRLVDTAAGEAIPEGATPMPRTSAGQVAALRRYTDAEAERLVSRDRTGHGESAVIGPDAPLPPVRGFTLSRLDFAAGATSRPTTLPHAEVVFVHAGSLAVEVDGATVDLGRGDTLTVPRGAPRHYRAAAGATAFIVRGAS